MGSEGVEQREIEKGASVSQVSRGPANQSLGSTDYAFQAKAGDGAPEEANAGKAGERRGETDARGGGDAGRPGEAAFVNDRIF